jgi:hypothetical protein
MASYCKWLVLLSFPLTLNVTWAAGVTRRAVCTFGTLICSTLALQTMHLRRVSGTLPLPSVRSRMGAAAPADQPRPLIRPYLPFRPAMLPFAALHALTGAATGPLTRRYQSLPFHHCRCSMMASPTTQYGRDVGAGPSKKPYPGRSASSLSDISSTSDANIRNFAPVARIMKTALPDNAKIAKEAKECMQECVSEFISFITSEGTLLPLRHISIVANSG